MLTKVIVWGLYAIVLVSPTQFSFPVKGIHLSLVDPLIWGIAGLWFVQCVLSKSWRALLPPLASLALILLMTMSVTQAENTKDSLKELIQLIEYVILIMVLFCQVPLSDTQRKHLLVLAGAGLVVNVLIALGQYVSSGVEVLNVGGGFGNRNVFGSYLAIGLPFVLALVLSPVTVWIRLVGLGVGFLGLVTLLSGGAALALVVALMVVGAAYRGKWAACAAAVLMLFALLIWPNLPRNNVEPMLKSVNLYAIDDEVMVEPRYTEWQVALQMWQENPWLGVGLGNYQEQVGQYYFYLPDPEGPQEPDRNNLYGVVIATTGGVGLLGLFIWIGWLASCHLQRLQGAQSPLQRALTVGALGALCAFCIMNLWSSLIVRGVMVVFVTLQALALRDQNT